MRCDGGKREKRAGKKNNRIQPENKNDIEVAPQHHQFVEVVLFRRFRRFRLSGGAWKIRHARLEGAPKLLASSAPAINTLGGLVITHMNGHMVILLAFRVECFFLGVVCRTFSRSAAL